jgi:hypothetical protein
VTLRLLLCVSRRSLRSRPLRALLLSATSLSRVGVVTALSRLLEARLCGVRLRDRGLVGDLDLELLLRRDLRVLGGGDGLLDTEIDLRRLTGRGERERELSDGVSDLRRGTRSGLLPLPLPPRPRYVLLRLSGVLDLRRGVGERERGLDDERRRRRGGGDRDSDADLVAEADRDSDVEGLLSSRAPRPCPAGTYVSDALGRNEPRSLESRRRGGDLE